MALILVFLLCLSLFVKSLLKSDKLKALIIPRAEEFIGRKVNIDQIHISLFKGIILKGIAVKEPDGAGDFITTREFILDYSLLPLLKKQIVITKIVINAPYVSVKKEEGGRYNFSDIIEKVQGEKGAPESERAKEKEFPLSIITDKVLIRDAIFEFSDSSKELPDVAAKADIDVTASLGKSLKDMTVSGSVDLKELKAMVNGIQTNTSGRIEMTREAVQIDLNTALGKDSFKLSGTVKDYLASPDITLNLVAKEIDLERLMALGGKNADGGDLKGKGLISEKTSRGKNGKEKQIAASGDVQVDAARYKGYTLKDFILKYRLRNDVVTIEPLSLHFSGGDMVKAEGIFKGKVQFAYTAGSLDAASGIKKTLTGRATADLTTCEVKQSKITDGIALVTGLDDLRSPHFENGAFQFTIKDEKVYLEGNMNSTNLRIHSTGSVDFAERIDVVTDLNISPVLAAKMPTAGIAGYLKDEKGWSIVPLRIVGTAEKPSVKLNTAALGKQLEKGIQGEIGKRLFKGIFGK